MNTPLKRIAPWACALVVLCSWDVAFAKHPVREIPIYAHLFAVPNEPLPWNDTRIQNMLNVLQIQLDFANRVYANANIKFTLDAYHKTGFLSNNPSDSVIVISPPDSNAAVGCWGDDLQADNDIAKALVRDPDVTDGISLMMPRYVHPELQPPQQTGVCPRPCVADADCGSYKCSGIGGLAGKYCIKGASYSDSPYCVDANCAYTETCQKPNTIAFVWTFPSETNGLTRQIAHEIGHYLGLAHPFAPYGTRCYDPGQQDADCGWDTRFPADADWCTGSDPGSNGSCAGIAYPAWKNIMSYHRHCQVAYGGETAWTGGVSPEQDWNSSLSPDQIRLIQHTLRVYYDPAVITDFHLGGYESFYVAGSTDTRSVTGYDGWDPPHVSQPITTAWVKGDVRIVQADADGDGVLDAIVSTTAGGTAFWRGGRKTECPLIPYCWQVPKLTYVRTLDASATAANSILSVGDFMGDGADDVLISKSSGTTQFPGQEFWGPSSALSYVLPTGWYWDYIRPTIASGNFTGAFARLDTVDPTHADPATITEDRETIAYSTPARRALLHDYDELYVRFPTGAPKIYRPMSDGTGFSAAGGVVQAPAGVFTGWNSGAWAANSQGDYHDELLVRTDGEGLRLLPGVDSAAGDFDFQNAWAATGWNQITSTAKVWTGDFSGLQTNNWGHGDFLISASGPQSHLGTKLWYGTFNGLLEGPFHRTDLTPSTTDAAVADFVRAKFDDVMIVTPSGAELLAGATGGTFMTGVWTSTSYSSSTHAWFGRR